MTEDLNPPDPQDLDALRQIVEQATAIGLVTQAELDDIFADTATGLTYDEAILRLHHLLRGETTAGEPNPE
ncbi:MAG: hypothetical protein ACFCVB_11595 [Nodosilinea sp.]